MLKFKCNKNFKLAGLLAVVAVFVGCAGALDDASDSSAPSVKSSTPAQGAVNVNVRTEIKVVMSESVDPSTVTYANVVLKTIRSTGAEKVTGAVSYDSASKTITFTPSNEFSKKAALGFNERYRLTLANIEDRAGNSIVLQHIEFQTTKNLQSLHYTYTTAGAINGYTGYTYEDGKLTREVIYTGIGTGVWGDADDVIGNYYKSSYDASGKLTRVVNYTAANAGTWFDGDETIGGYQAYTYNAEGYVLREATYTAVGATGNTTWFDDDDVGTYIEYTYYFDGTLARRSTHGPGPNGKLFDSDDVVTGYTKYTYDGSASLTGAITYNQAANGTWFDADDVVSGYTANAYDATSGYQTQAAVYTGAGADKQWFTSEDVGTYSKYTYSADGTATRITNHVGGNDIKLFTSDDVMTSYSQLTYKTNGPLTQSVNYSGIGTGSTTWFDGDDVSTDFSAFTSDASGNITRRVNYSGWGQDLRLFNDDDVVASYADYFFDANYNREHFTYYSAAGADANSNTPPYGWFTGDDIKAEKYYFNP